MQEVLDRVPQQVVLANVRVQLAMTRRQLVADVRLFIRDAPRDKIGAAPFLCLGRAAYVGHRGERPIAITWRPHRPMPADTFATASVVAH